MIVFNLNISHIVSAECVLFLALEAKHHVAAYLALQLLIGCELEDAKRRRNVCDIGQQQIFHLVILRSV